LPYALPSSRSPYLRPSRPPHWGLNSIVSVFPVRAQGDPNHIRHIAVFRGRTLRGFLPGLVIHTEHPLSRVRHHTPPSSSAKRFLFLLMLPFRLVSLYAGNAPPLPNW